MNIFTHSKHTLLSNRAATFFITLLLLIAASLGIGVTWAADGEWTDPVGDVTLPNADIISGSAIVSGDVIDLRVQFQATPYPYNATHSVSWCFDTDQNAATGNACGSGSGFDKAFALWGGLGAIDTGDFSISAFGGVDSPLSGVDPCAKGSYDPNSKTIRLRIPRSYLDGDGIFSYKIVSAFGGSFGVNDHTLKYLNGHADELFPFVGQRLCQLPPTLQVSPTDLSFAAAQGEGDPASQFLSIGDEDTGPLNWAASKDADWLELSASTGTTPAQIQVSVDTAGMDSGVYTGHITVSSSDAQRGSPQTVYVSVVIDPTTVEATCPANRAGQFITGYEDGGGPQPVFEWYESLGERSFATTDTMKLAFYIVPFGSGDTLVALDESNERTGYSLDFANGLVNGVVPYTANGWNSVEAEFDFATQHYVLTVNGTSSAPLPFYFSDSRTIQALRVHSADTSEETSAWLDSISIMEYGDGIPTALFLATFDNGRSYMASLGTIQSVYPPATLSLPAPCISGTTPIPRLQVSPADLQFTAVEGDDSLDAQSIFISNGGTSYLNWIASEDIDWLSLSSSAGTAPAAVQATVTLNGLSAGEYSGPITIFGDGAQGSPKTVNVYLHVKPSLSIVLGAASGYDNVRLDWNPTNNPYVTSYSVERSTGQSGDFTPIAVVSDTTYLDDDSTLEAGTEYCYRVVARRSDGSLVKESDVDCATVGQLDLWVPDTWAAPGQTAVVPVKIRNAAGLRLAAGDIWLNYDGTVIDLLDISKTPMASGYTWEYAISSTSTYSQARIAAISDPPPMLYGNGSLFWLKARVTGSEGQTSTVAFQEFIAGLGGTALYAPEDLFHPIPLQLQNGVFHVASGYLLGDLNGDGVIQAADAYLALQIGSGELRPVAEQRLAGDVNGDDQVDAADASMILYYAVHSAWPQLPAAGVQDMAAQADDTVRLSLDDAHGPPGANVRTNLRAENLSDWAGGEILVAYDPRVVTGITGVEVGQLVSGFALKYYDEEDGLLRIELAGNGPVSGSGVVATISMRVASNTPGGKTSPIALADARLHDTTGRDFATSALQRTIVREGADLHVDLRTYLPLVIKQR